MEEIEVKICLQNTSDSSPRDSEIHQPMEQLDDINSQTKTSQPKTPRKIVRKKATNRSPKIPTKRRKYVRKKIIIETNECILEDSIQKLLPQQNVSEASYLLPVVDLLEKCNFKYEVMPESQKHDNFFLQDKYMNTFSKYYPEYLCIDFLCEIPELELNLCLFISIDGNGYCEIIALGLIKSFDSGLLWLCDIFKKYNPNWRKIRLIVCDKKARNLEVIKMAFPEKIVLISFFHSLKALRKDLTNLDNKVPEKDITEAIHIFEQMVFAPDEPTYVELLKQLKLLPPSLVVFFRKAWHQKKDSWSLGHQINSKTFLKSVNSYLLSIRKKIRPMVNTQESVANVIEKLSCILETIRKERFQNFTSIFYTTSVHGQEYLFQRYSKFLTQYAAELVFEQFTNSSNVKNVRKLSCGKYVCPSEDIVTTNACSCSFFQLFSLPCCHIFAIRKLLSLPLFAEILSSNRWIAMNYQNTYLDLQNIFASEHTDSESGNAGESEKFQKCFKLSAELWPLLVDCSESVSQDRLQILKYLLEAWKSDIKLNIKTSEVQIASNYNFVGLEDSSPDYWKELYGASLKDMLDSDNELSSISFYPEMSSDFI